MSETKTALEVGFVEADGVATTDTLYFAQDRLAVRLEGPDGIVVAALSRQAARKLGADVQAWTGDRYV